MLCRKCGKEIGNIQICGFCGNNNLEGVVHATPSLNVQTSITSSIQQPIDQPKQPMQQLNQNTIQPVTPTQPTQVNQPSVTTTNVAPIERLDMITEETPLQQPVQVVPSAPTQQPMVQQPVRVVPTTPTQQPMVQQPVQVVPNVPVQQPMVQQINQSAIPPMQPAQPIINNIQNNGFQSASVSLDAPVVTNLQPIKVPKRKNYSGILAVLAIILIVLTAYIYKTQVFDAKNKEVVLKESGTRTLMIYMLGSNLESDYGAASSDIEEIIKSKFDEETLNVVIYTGGANEWENPEISNEENAIYEINSKGLNKIKTYDQKDMSDQNTLQEFIDYTYENYKSDLYDLILWDHGGGPIYGYGSDEISNSNSMEIEEINNAITQSQLGKNTKLEFLGFDACLMSSVEVAYALNDSAKYLVASEEIIPAFGWNYDFLNKISKTTTSTELTKSIVDSFFEYYNDLSAYYTELGYKFNPDLTLSVTDLNETIQLVNDIDKLFANVEKNISISNYSKVATGFSRATLYGYQGSDNTSYDLVDLYDLISSIADEYDEANAVLEQINKTIIYERNNIKGSNGLSVYFPMRNKTYASQLSSKYQDVKFSKNYKLFVDKYVSISKGSKLVSSNTKSLTPVVNENKISVELDNDLIENYQSAKYVIYRKLGDNQFMPVNISSDVKVSGNTIYTEGTTKQLIVHPVLSSKPEGTIISPGWLTMLEQNRTDEYAIYAIAAVIERYDDETNKLETKSVFLMYKIYNNETKGEIIDVVETSTFGTTAMKNGINLTEWQQIKFMNFSYKLYDENGEFLDTMETNSKYYITTSDITENLNIEFVSLDYDMNMTVQNTDGNVLDIDTDNYYYQFIVTDTQGINHRTQLVKLS